LKTIEIYTDGACRGNPGPGGWGVLLLAGRHRKTMHGGDPETTNNRMELTAAIEALNALKKPSKVILHTDSKYVMDGINEWMANWKKRGWKTAAKKPVLNADLWHDLIEAAARHEIEWNWVKAHNGHPENERVDQLASERAEQVGRGE